MRLIDKLMFGAVLIAALQVPQLADHYLQFLSGRYKETQQQLDGYRATAVQHNFDSVEALIDHHLTNADASVRSDAIQKLVTLDRHKTLAHAISIFKNESLLHKAAYMFNPARLVDLQNTLVNFKLGIPLTASGVGFGVVSALVIHYTTALPFVIWTRRKNARKESARKA